MKLYRKVLIGLFVFFGVLNLLYLHRVPGLMGDEASEGQNVFELLEREGITVQGERSYIGPLIDYVRVPFMAAFGYTALAIRLPMFFASLLTFALAASVFRRWFGDEVSLFPLTAMAFSQVYLTQQRLGWAITLFPFFFFLIIWLAQRPWPYKWVFVGLAAGLALHTHIMFAPTLAALIVTSLIWVLRDAFPQTSSLSSPAPARLAQGKSAAPLSAVAENRARRRSQPAQRLGARVALGLGIICSLGIGFWAGFGTQFIILQLFPEDQGDPAAVGEVMSERIAALPDLLPLLVSGSSYVARYTGAEFSPAIANGVTGLVAALALVAVILSWRNKMVWLWMIGLAVQLGVLLYMIDRFTLRYFIMFVLGTYVLAGLGAGEIIIRIARRLKRPWFIPLKAVGLAVALALLWLWLVVAPFVRTGGSVADFSLGNRTDSAAALVDVRPLIECLRGAGSASSENVHVYNRLLYLSHHYEDLVVIPENEARSAEYLVHYREPKSPLVPREQELCPALQHFIVERNN